MFRKKAGDRPVVLRPCSSGERPLQRRKALQLCKIEEDVEIYLCICTLPKHLQSADP